MASVQKGTFGVVWGLGTTVSASGLGTCTVQSVDFGVETKKKEIVSSDGETRCVVYHDQQDAITIEVVPSGATIAAAKTAGASGLPAIGADVTITDSDDSEVAASTWVFEGGSKRKTVDGEVRVTMNLRKFGTTLPTIS